MAAYELKVHSENTDPIEFSIVKNKKFIESVKFTMNTLDDNVTGRANGIRAEFIIKGVISDETKNEVQKLAAWAITTEDEELYRFISILVKNNDSESAKTLRRYEFSDMFVLDYREEFLEGKSKDADGNFELFIAQRDGGEIKKVLPN